MKAEPRLSLDVERDWEWCDWPDTEQAEDDWEAEGMSLTAGGPHQIELE